MSSTSNLSPSFTATMPAMFECHRPAVMELLRAHQSLISIAGMIADYVIYGELFGPEEWERFFGVQPECCALDVSALEKFWLAKDVQYPDQCNYHTHLGLTLFPQKITPFIPPVHRHRFASYTHITKYNFEVLERLVQAPRAGHPSKLTYASPTFRKLARIDAGTTCWLATRRKLFFRGCTTVQQQIRMQRVNRLKPVNYCILPSALELSTAVLTERVRSGKRYLGDETGAEGCRTESRTADAVQERPDLFETLPCTTRVSVGYHTAESGLHLLDRDFDNQPDIGVTPMCRFYGKRVRVE